MFALLLKRGGRDDDVVDDEELEKIEWSATSPPSLLLMRKWFAELSLLIHDLHYKVKLGEVRCTLCAKIKKDRAFSPASQCPLELAFLSIHFCYLLLRGRL